MQPEPTEIPSNELAGPSSSPPSLAQHGFRNDDLFSDSSSIRHADDNALLDSEVDTLSSISGESRGRRSSTRRLSSTRSSQRGSPVDRIFQHERVNALGKKRNTTLEFKVVPSASGTAPTISIDDFPNGKFGSVCPVSSANIVRGHHAYPVASSSTVSVRHESGVPALSCIGNHSPRLEDCLLPLFSRQGSG